MSVPPKQQLQQLILLQKVDDDICDYKKLLTNIPVQVDVEKKELDAKKKILTSANDELELLQKKRKDIEMEVQRENDHMAKAKTKLPAVKTNKEYTAILSEVDMVKKKVSGLEDQELEVMEILEVKQKEIPGIKKKFEEEEGLFREYKEKKEAELKRMEQELSSLNSKRDKLKEQLDNLILQRYEKVAKSRGGRAVVSLSENICQGCFQQVLPQMVINVKVGESIQQCSNCARFLFWEETAAMPK